MKDLTNSTLIAIPNAQADIALEILATSGIQTDEENAPSIPFQNIARYLLESWLEETALTEAQQKALIATVTDNLIDFAINSAEASQVVVDTYSNFVADLPMNRHEDVYQERASIMIDREYLASLEAQGIPFDVKPPFQAFCEEEVRFILNNDLLYDGAKDYYDNASPEEKEQIFQAMVEELFDNSSNWINEERLQICNDLITYAYLEEE